MTIIKNKKDLGFCKSRTKRWFMLQQRDLKCCNSKESQRSFLNGITFHILLCASFLFYFTVMDGETCIRVHCLWEDDKSFPGKLSLLQTNWIFCKFFRHSVPNWDFQLQNTKWLYEVSSFNRNSNSFVTFIDFEVRKLPNINQTMQI